MKNLQPTNYKLQTNLGFTLLETVIAISILTTGVIATIGLMNSGLKQIGFLKNKIVAINLAQEGIELVRNVRDNNWLAKDPLDNTKLANKGFNAWTSTLIDVCSFSTPCKYVIDYDDDKLTLIPEATSSTSLKNSNDFYQYNSPCIDPCKDTIFKRTITITDNAFSDINNLGTTNVRVESTVKFGLGDKENEEITLEAILYDWKK